MVVLMEADERMRDRNREKKLSDSLRVLGVSAVKVAKVEAVRAAVVEVEAATAVAKSEVAEAMEVAATSEDRNSMWNTMGIC